VATTTTTYEAIRGDQIAAIHAISPSLKSDVPFIADLAQVDFRAWAEKNPAASLRRFCVVDLFDEDATEVSSYDVEDRRVRAEIVVAYPRVYAYGTDADRDRRDMMRADRIAIVNAAGLRGSGNIANASIYDQRVFSEEGDNVAFLVLEHSVFFWIDVS